MGSAALFPTRLPLPHRDGYTGSPALEKRRHLMDDGFYSDPRRWNSQPFAYKLNWKFTNEQQAYFDAWIEYEVLQGSGWFQLSLAGRTVTLRPTDEPQVEHAKGSWEVVLNVEEIRAAPVMPPKAGLPQWPNDLPTLEQDNYGYANMGSWTRSEIETGLAEARNRFRNKCVAYRGEVLLTQSQLVSFWNFYRDTLADGTGWFGMPFENGLGRSYVRSKFGAEAPTESPLGSMYTVSLTFETGAAPKLSRKQFYNA